MQSFKLHIIFVFPSQHYDLNRSTKKKKKLLVSGVTGVGEHLDVVPGLHHIVAHERVDDGSLDHI